MSQSEVLLTGPSNTQRSAQGFSLLPIALRDGEKVGAQREGAKRLGPDEHL